MRLKQISTESNAFARHAITWLFFTLFVVAGVAHEAKDFDDTVLYTIDFEVPQLLDQPEVQNQLRKFYTHEKEEYSCVIPTLAERKEEVKSNGAELSPLVYLSPMINAASCSYRIEAYWSYEICHGNYVRQYHEEREGKSVKFQEYYLGKWSTEKTEQLVKTWKEQTKDGNNKIKYRTTKIDNIKYPYFEMEFSDGTLCDIIDSPRTTLVRYVCYPHGKNEIYSFKETSSCNYEAVILTSLLCKLPAFHPEKTKEESIKCFNSPTEAHKPLSMLRQELNELQISEEDFPLSKEAKTAAALWPKPDAGSEQVTYKFDGDVEKLILELMTNSGIDVDAKNLAFKDAVAKATAAPVSDMTPIKEFISGKNCLTGGTGWWKYEFCYGRHVRQFHKDKNSEVELFLGFFTETSHRQWITANPEKGAKRNGVTATIWHHYEKGTRCDRTGLPREVDVKLTCTPVTNSGTSVSMYLLEPKTCQYILVVESPIICELMHYADEFGLVKPEKLQKFLEGETDATGDATASSEQTTTPTEEQAQIRA